MTTSPYIVTVKDQPNAQGLIEIEMPISRRAVATLDDARDAAYAEVNAHMEPGEARVSPQVDAMALPESGGTVGPLPDGTVIVVERTRWSHLATLPRGEWGPTIQAASSGDTKQQGRLIGAYNAAQA